MLTVNYMVFFTDWSLWDQWNVTCLCLLPQKTDHEVLTSIANSKILYKRKIDTAWNCDKNRTNIIRTITSCKPQATC